MKPSACDMGSGLALLVESAGVVDLTVAKGGASSAEVHPGVSAFGTGVIDPFAFGPEIHLREGCHDSEDHWLHLYAGINVPAFEFRTRKLIFCA